MNELLTLTDVHLAYGPAIQALAGVNLTLGTEAVGLLGPNGAGKTTLLSVLARLLVAQKGRGRFFGHALENPDSRTGWLENLSFLPQEENFPSLLSGREVVELALALGRPGWPCHLRREITAEMLARVGLKNAADRKAKTYSGGMKRRLGLARALATRPRLLLIDEPTSGLDPDERVEFRELLTGVAETAAVLVSTHIVADVELACSRVIVFLGGQIAWSGSPSGLMAESQGRVHRLIAEEGVIQDLMAQYRVTSLVRHDARVMIRFLTDGSGGVPGEVVSPTLEEAYLDLLQRRGDLAGAA